MFVGNGLLGIITVLHCAEEMVTLVVITQRQVNGESRLTHRLQQFSQCSVVARLPGVVSAIAIDDWKLTIFARRLKKAGFVYEQFPGVTEDTLLLTVYADSSDAVVAVVKAANTEAARVGTREGQP